MTSSVTAPVSIFWSSREWALAIAALPAPGVLPCRTVLVPREGVAHSLRRELIRAGQSVALIGTRFVPSAVAAAEVLGAARVDFRTGEEALRPARLLTISRRGVHLEHFPPQLLRDRPGWDEAFARTIGDLEAAGLRPDDLRGPGTVATLRDIATVWQAADELAGSSWTIPRLYLEAARVLETSPQRWPFEGPTLATATGPGQAAQARFFRAIPGVAVGLLTARPVRSNYLARVEMLFGADAARALCRSAAPPPASGATERDLLASYLFEPPDVLAHGARPRSRGPDGTVSLEEHGGLDDEIEATADWVARQVIDGIALEDIAVLAPALDPFAGLIAERLARLPWPGGATPVYVAGGWPLTSTASGARALAAVRALRAHLGGVALAALLPALRTMPPTDATGAESHHLSHGAATDLVWSLGTPGGNPAHPEGALDWATRAAHREPTLAAQLERAQNAGDDDPEQAGLARRARDIERLLNDLRAVRPALEALVEVARLAVGGATLAALWPAFAAFLERWLLQPGDGPRVQVLLDERLAAAARDPTCGALVGDDALRIIEETILTLRLATGRFGEPAVYVCTVQDAVGLRFKAVRVVGLAEGYLPDPPREDPVLPDTLRAALAAGGARPVAPTTIADRALVGLHALDAVVRDAEARVALSAPRLDLERSQREPSSVLLEAAAALGRPNAVSGQPGAVIPDTQALRRDAFLPARTAALTFRRQLPLGEAAWQDGVAAGLLSIPDRWRTVPAIDLVRIERLIDAPEAGAMDGFLTSCGDVPVPGLTAEWPLSPSTLGTLLSCPHQFLLQRVLGLDEPAGPPPLREIGQPAYGALVHRVAEAFFRSHGAAFAGHGGTLDAWLELGGQFAERVLDEFLEEYPLVGAAVRGAQRQRLRDDIVDLVRHEWEAGASRRFVDVERPFGPVALPAGARELHVRGRIDRIDVEGGHTLVRDIKTGRAHPRRGNEVEPHPVLDAQIAIYGLVARLLAAKWGTPPRVRVAYTHINRGVAERAFRDDFEKVLAPAARGWLDVAARLLEARAFPRTPSADDCRFCAFRPVCGDGVYERALQLLRSGDDTCAAFLAIKGHAEREGEE
jgi:RecB family exonuclease